TRGARASRLLQLSTCILLFFNDAATTYIYTLSLHDALPIFVVVSGYDSETNQVLVNDPLMDNPYSPKQQYNVKIEKLICSILLGVLTYDAKLLIIEPKKSMT